MAKGSNAPAAAPTPVLGGKGMTPLTPSGPAYNMTGQAGNRDAFNQLLFDMFKDPDWTKFAQQKGFSTDINSYLFRGEKDLTSLQGVYNIFANEVTLPRQAEMKRKQEQESAYQAAREKYITERRQAPGREATILGGLTGSDVSKRGTILG